MEDVRVLVVMRRNTAEDRLLKMISDRTLPVFQDTHETNVQRLYGVSRKGSYLIFDRDGCLIPEKIEYTKQMQTDPRLLLPYLPG